MLTLRLLFLSLSLCLQCKDRHISHVPKGSLWYLPCSSHHAHIAKWHWKAEDKRSWKGDACSCELHLQLEGGCEGEWLHA